MNLQELRAQRNDAKLAGDALAACFQTIVDVRNAYPEGPDAFDGPVSFSDHGIVGVAIADVRNGENIPEAAHERIRQLDRTRSTHERAMVKAAESIALRIARIVEDMAKRMEDDPEETWLEAVLDELDEQNHADTLDEGNLEEIQAIRAMWLHSIDVALALRKKLDDRLSQDNLRDVDALEEQIPELVNDAESTAEALRKAKRNAEAARKVLLRFVTDLEELAHRMDRKDAYEWREAILESLQEEDSPAELKKQSEDWVALPSLALLVREKIDESLLPDEDAAAFDEEVRELLFGE